MSGVAAINKEPEVGGERRVVPIKRYDAALIDPIVLMNYNQVRYGGNKGYFFLFGEDLSKEEFIRLWIVEGGRGARGFAEEKNLIGRKAELSNGHYIILSEEHIKKVRLEMINSLAEVFLKVNPYCSDLLNKMWYNDIRMGVVSSDRGINLMRYLEIAKIDHYFNKNAIIHLDIAERDKIKIKPAPDSFKMGMDKLNAEPKTTIALCGDTAGIRAAHSAGIECIVAIVDKFTEGLQFDGDARPRYGPFSSLDKVLELNLF